jgi:Protein of unknown function (DUF2384)
MPNSKRSRLPNSRRGQLARPRARKAGGSKSLAGAPDNSTSHAANKMQALKERRTTAPQTAPEGFRGSRLVSAFVDEKGFVSVERVAGRFGMSKVQLAETIGVKPETIYRAARLEAPKTQARATEMLEIVGRIVDWAGGERQAMAWYRAEPIAAFGGRTAESLVKEGRAVAVRDYLDHVATGGFA